MGMGASQCRLLTLTSYMSDLELQAQLITNQKMILSRRLSDITRKYTEAISNQQLFIRAMDDSGTITTSSLTAQNLFGAGYGVQVGGATYETLSSFTRKYGNANGEGERNSILQYLLINGQAMLIDLHTDSDADGSADRNFLNIGQVSTISQTYYTGDDAAAEAEYNRLTREVESKEELLDLELDQIETQHEAAQTEYDSVKDVIKKNIERTFKVFG